MPAIAWPRATAAQLSRDRGAELQYPSAHRFIGDVEPSFGQQLLDIAVAQGEAEIEPDRVLDDLGREAMAMVADRSHADILSDTTLSRPGFRDKALHLASATASSGAGRPSS